MAKDYYKVLGITEKEKQLQGKEFEDLCKKKFRKLSVKWHPDKWVNASEEEKKKAEETFKDINEAHDVLSDPQKRQMYDNGGDLDFGGVDPFDWLRHRRGSSKGGNQYVTIVLTPEETFRGGNHKVKVPRMEVCDHCHGTGSEDGKAHICPHCQGQGVIEDRQTNGNMMFVSRRTCPYCGGTGKENTTPCKKCGGSGKKIVEEEVEAFFPKGLVGGEAINVTGMGLKSVDGGPNGDLIVRIEIKSDGYFDIDANRNVVHKEAIPFNLAILGTEQEVRCIDGTKVKIKVPPLTKDCTILRLKGKGLPSPYDESVRADYLVTVIHKYPKTLTEKQKETLRDFDK